MGAIFAGIDVSKDRLDVHVHPRGEVLTLERTGVGLDALSRRLLPLAPILVAVEATGGLETLVAAALAGAGLPLVVVNPSQVRSFANALGKRAKTDRFDAGVIARFIAAAKPQPRPLPDEVTLILADLVAHSVQLKRDQKKARSKAG